MLTIDGYTIDAEITGEPTYESEMTGFPMERGANMNDHVRNLPIGFNAEGIISDSPLGAVRTIREASGTGTTGRAITDAGNAYMIGLWRRKTPITVTCSLGTFDNMVLLSYVPRREGGSIRFQARFMHANFVTNERTTVRVKVPSGQGTKKKKASADPFEGPAMWRTVDYDVWVRNGRKGARVMERVGRIPDPSGQLPWLWTHSDGVTPLDAWETELWELEQRDNAVLEEPTPGYKPGKVPGQLEKIPFDPFNPDASASATDRGAAYFDPNQGQWVSESGTPIMGNPGQWGEQWNRFGEEEQRKINERQRLNDAAEDFIEGGDASGLPPDEMDLLDSNGDGQFGPGDEGWE